MTMTDQPTNGNGHKGLKTAAELAMTRESPSPADDPRAQALAALWRSTPAELVAKLPRYCGPKDTPKAQRQRGSCNVCGGFHELPAIHLDYLGHSDTTRLIAEADPFWQWEPKAGWDDNGEPHFIRDGKGYPVRLWIDLTILGVTRPGVGTVEGAKSDPEKELIGDALRNAAMRFGIGADLWSKAAGVGGLDDDPARSHPTAPPRLKPEVEAAIATFDSAEAYEEAHREYGRTGKDLTSDEREALKTWKAQQNIGWPLDFDSWRALMGFIRGGFPPLWSLADAIEYFETGDPGPDPEPPADADTATPPPDDIEQPGVMADTAKAEALAAQARAEAGLEDEAPPPSTGIKSRS